MALTSSGEVSAERGALWGERPWFVTSCHFHDVMAPATVRFKLSVLLCRGAEGARDAHVSGWGDGLVGKSACYVNMKVSGCARDPSAVGTGTRGSLGFVGHQPSARFNERPCLKGKKWRVISRTPDVLLWPLLGHPPHTPHVHAHGHTQIKQKRGVHLAIKYMCLDSPMLAKTLGEEGGPRVGGKWIEML